MEKGARKPKIEIVEGGDAYSLTSLLVFALRGRNLYRTLAAINIVVALYGLIANPRIMLDVHARDTGLLLAAHIAWLVTALLAFFSTKLNKFGIMAICVPGACIEFFFRMPVPDIGAFIRIMFSTPYSIVVLVLVLLNFICPDEEVK